MTRDQRTLDEYVGVARAECGVTWLFDPGTKLPARRGFECCLSRALCYGEANEELNFAVVVGDKDDPATRRDLGSLSIRRDHLKQDLPIDTVLEVALLVDQEKRVHIKVYVPRVDESFECTISTFAGSPDSADIREDLVHQDQRFLDSYDMDIPVTAMELEVVDVLDVRCGSDISRIELCVGDVTSIAEQDPVDVLVVSAFSGGYGAASGSVMAALERKGISVASLAQDKEVDLRNAFSCWMSKELRGFADSVRFKRILCYEPSSRGTAAQTIGGIFRCLAPFLGEEPPIRTVVAPLVASGYQGEDPCAILRLLVEAASHWIRAGLPISRFKIACLPDSRVEALKKLFIELKHDYSTNLPAPRHAHSYDFFISYARVDAEGVALFERSLLGAMPNIRMFIDRMELNAGSAWQQKIYESLDDCRRVITFLTPAYLNSKVCLEEFNIALCRNREATYRVMAPVYLYSATLPTYMRLLQHYDCRECSRQKIEEATSDLAREFSSPA